MATPNNPYLSRMFWVDTAERAVKTAAQAALGVLTVGATGVLDADFVAVGSVGALAAIVSVLTSVAGRNIGEPDTASLVRLA